MTAEIHSLGIVGRKAGMSRVFTEDGKSVPVTLIEATPNRITQIKTVEVDGYSAVQVTTGSRRAAPFTPTPTAPSNEITIQPMPMLRAVGTSRTLRIAMKRTMICGCPK